MVKYWNINQKREESLFRNLRLSGSLPKRRLISVDFKLEWRGESGSRSINSSRDWDRCGLGFRTGRHVELSIFPDAQMPHAWWMERALWESLYRITIDDSNYERIFQLRRSLNHVNSLFAIFSLRRCSRTRVGALRDGWKNLVKRDEFSLSKAHRMRRWRRLKCWWGNEFEERERNV